VRCIDGVCVCVCVDLFTGGFSYDHKFSVDTKTAGDGKWARPRARARRRVLMRAWFCVVDDARVRGVCVVNEY